MSREPSKVEDELDCKGRKTGRGKVLILVRLGGASVVQAATGPERDREKKRLEAVEEPNQTLQQWRKQSQMSPTMVFCFHGRDAHGV
ncbi:hypothetical protein CEP51_008841 [Fusarium floridanum]|uniref:Uncharacterized protein n=1 Tax=Fusarium floridanum TaxID=1325733 RepID=A0A428RJK7_9HYPO|nr:hypothetical protein CEP51_008841 [Fusarium floridanum]